MAHRGGAAMPWKKTSPMRERTEFIVEHRSGLYSFSALCEKYQISRKTGYKFLQRLRGRRARRASRPVACPEEVAAAAARRSGRAAGDGSAQASALGCTDDPGLPLPPSRARALAGTKHRGRALQTPRAGPTPTAASTARPPRQAADADVGAERRVDDRLQGAVPDPGRDLPATH